MCFWNKNLALLKEQIAPSILQIIDRELDWFLLIFFEIIPIKTNSINRVDRNMWKFQRLLSLVYWRTNMKMMRKQRTTFFFLNEQSTNLMW